MPGVGSPRLVALLLVTATSAHAEPISLKVAVDAALRSHPLLDRSAANREAADAHVGGTRAAFLPTISTFASARDDVVDPTNFVSSDPVGWGNRLTYDVGLNVTQLITDSGRSASVLAGAQALELAARAQIAVDRLDVELAVVQAYLEVLRNKDLVDVSTSAIALVDEQLARATALFQATIRPEIDVLSAETQRAQARLARLRDENAVASAQLTLLNAIGAKAQNTVDALPIEIAAVPEETQLASSLQARSLGKRPELTVLRDRIAATDASVRTARTRTSPVVTASTGVYANGGSDLSWSPGVGVFASIGVSMDLYVGRADEHAIDETQAQVRAAHAELERAEQNISLAVRRAALAVQISRETLAVATAWRVHADRQLQLAQSRYQTGVGNFVELNDARSGLVNAQRQEVQARYDLAQSRVSLARELGSSPSALATQP
jgi:outer membrane protein